MPTEATDTTYIALADDNRIADIVSSVLEFQGYRIRRVSRELKKAAASFELSERGRVPGGWNYKFDVTVRWKPDGYGAELDVLVEETKHSDRDSENMCKQRCSKLVLELIEAALAARAAQEEVPRDSRYGSAKFADDNELDEKGYVASRPDHRRLILAPLGAEKIAVPAEYTPHHAIVCGPTGAGKTSGILIPNIVERLSTSMIVTESTLGKRKPELFTKTAGWRSQAGHKVFWFNPNDMSSTRMNPIDLVRWAAEEDMIAEAEAITNLIIKNTEGPKEARAEPFWDRAEKHLLMSLIIHAAVDDPKYGHLGAVRWHLLKGLPHLAPMMSQSPSDIAAAEFNGFLLNTTDEIRKGVITGVFNRLNPWLTPQLVTLTACSDVTPDELKDSLFTFYLSAPVRRPDLQALSVLIFNYLLELALNVQYKHDLALLLDEFTNFGYIFGVTELLSTIRKTRISAVLGFQSLAQVADVYGQRPAEILLGQPATLVFYKPNTLEEAEFISRSLDSQTFHDVQVNDLGRRIEHFIPRPLLRPGEIRGLSPYQAIIFTPTTNPLRRFTFHWSQYEQATKYPPPERETHKIPDFIRRMGRPPIHSDDPPAAKPPTSNGPAREREQGKAEGKGRSKRGGPDFFND